MLNHQLSNIIIVRDCRDRLQELFFVTKVLVDLFSSRLSREYNVILTTINRTLAIAKFNFQFGTRLQNINLFVTHFDLC